MCWHCAATHDADCSKPRSAACRRPACAPCTPPPRQPARSQRGRGRDRHLRVLPARGPSQNNCFLNVILQPLWHLACFCQPMLELQLEQHAASKGASPQDQRVMAAIWHIFQAMAQTPETGEQGQGKRCAQILGRGTRQRTKASTATSVVSRGSARPWEADLGEPTADLSWCSASCQPLRSSAH